MTKITADAIYQRSPSATYQTVAGEAIVIDLNTGSYFSLNETGTWLWEHLDGQRSVAELARELAEVCGVPEQAATVQEDALELVSNLARETLVVSR